MKMLILWHILLMVISNGHTQEEQFAIIPLDTSNKWIYTSHIDDYLNPFDGDFTEIKQIIGDTLVAGIDHILVENTTIKDSILTISRELWRVDSTSFYIFDIFTNQEYKLYDTTVTHDSMWGGPTGWGAVSLFTEVWWGEIREIQQWEAGSDFHGVFWWRRFKTAKDLGLLRNYFEDSIGPVFLYISNLTGATINEIPYGNPAPPLGVTAIPDTHEVELRWSQNSEADILRYRIYSKILPDSIVLLDSTSNTDTVKTVSGLSSGKPYYFYLTAVDSEMNESNFSLRIAIQTLGSPTSIGEYHGNVIQNTTLFQNYPNPFNQITAIPFSLPLPADIEIGIYDINGRRLTTIRKKNLTAGEYSFEWNGLNANGQPVASGIYIYRLKATDTHSGQVWQAARKMVYLK